MRAGRFTDTRIIGLFLIAGLLGLWELSSAEGWVSPLSWPRVTAIARTCWDLIKSGELPAELALSSAACLSATLSGSVSGF